MPDSSTPIQSSALYTNPVWNDDFADPTIIRAADGWYYAYGTQTKRHGTIINLQVARSADLVQWDYLGEGLPVKPAWASSTQKPVTCRFRVTSRLSCALPKAVV